MRRGSQEAVAHHQTDIMDVTIDNTSPGHQSTTDTDHDHHDDNVYTTNNIIGLTTPSPTTYTTMAAIHNIQIIAINVFPANMSHVTSEPS